MKNEHPTLTSLGSEEPVLRSVSARGQLDGLLLSMSLHQAFRNDSDDNMEVVYTFPLGWGAVLLGLEATLGGKRMVGQVIARREARERYEEAVEKGDAPIMVEKTQGGVFRAALGSLKPGEEAIIELTYAQLLSFEQGRIRLVVPTTIAPRYGDSVTQGRLHLDQVTEPNLMTEHAFGLSVILTGPLTQARIGSPTHAITQQRQSDAAIQSVTVSLQQPAWLDRDFVLLLEGLEGRSFAIAGPDPKSATGHTALIASFCPSLPPAVPSHLRLKILVDCSGSMAGDSIEQARAALHPLAQSLTSQDQISYSRFGSRTYRDLEVFAATPHNVHRLWEAISETEADLGGTEMAAALKDTFDILMGASRHNEEADVLLITDGEVWDAQSIVNEARRSGHRIYALGVGSAPAESLLREMAEATGGACEFVSPNEDMARAIQRLLGRIRNTLPVKAVISMDDSPLWSSPLPRRMAAGETAHVFMRLPTAPIRSPILRLTGQEEASVEFSVREDDLIAHLVAASQVGLTADKAQAMAVAERYQLVTDDTNLLLVIERDDAEKTDGMPLLHQVRPMLAAGWGGTGKTRRVKVAPHSGVTINLSMAAPTSTPSAPSSGSFKALLDDSDDLDDFDEPEISDFLSMESDKAFWDSELFASSGSNEQTGPATAVQIISAFNAEARLGQPYRSTLRAVIALGISPRLNGVLAQASRQVGSLQKAWACYLLWLHEIGLPELWLTDEALDLVQSQLEAIGAVECDAATQLFPAIEKTT